MIVHQARLHGIHELGGPLAAVFLAPFLAAVAATLVLRAFGAGVRWAAGTEPGSQRDPLRQLAACLANRLVLVRAGGLALAVVSCFVCVAFGAPVAEASWLEFACTALLFLILGAHVQTRRLPWLAKVAEIPLQAGTVSVAAIRFESPLVPPVVSCLLSLASMIVAVSVGRPDERMSSATGYLVDLVLLGMAIGLFACVTVREVTVGVDGIRVVGFAARFFPFDGRSRMSATERDIVVSPRGRRWPLRLGYPELGASESRLLAERVRDLAQANDRTEAQRAELDLPPLRAGHHYREVEIPRDLLWRIVASPPARTDARLRAARLLAAQPAPGDGARLVRLLRSSADESFASQARALVTSDSCDEEANDVDDVRTAGA